MSTIAANMEWLFTEAGEDTADRIRAAADHGLTAVEMWGWRDKDLDAIEAALTETGVQLLSLIVDPKLDLTDRRNHAHYLEGVSESLAVAQRLGAPYLVAVAGDEIEGVARDVQRAAVVAALTDAAAILDGTDVTLLLENLNTKVDHVGTFLYSTREGLDIVREVDSTHLKLLLDAYHALMMDENLVIAIGDDIAQIGHVQVADAPGRHEPGTGELDWGHQLGALRDLGYTGFWGMEYTPTIETVASLRHIEELAAQVDSTRLTAG
jgi:hydroxypyruvate isomerase